MTNHLAILGGRPVRKEPYRMHSPFGEEEVEAAADVVRQGHLSVFRGGPTVKAFEKAFAEYIGCSHAISMTSGTTALQAAVSALDLPLESEVIVPSMTFISTVSVVLQEGLIPVFVDIEKESYGMDPVDVSRKLTPRTKAIIPVHLFGHPARIAELKEIADLHNLYMIEDCAQAHGAMYGDAKVGTFGDLGCFSFFQTKNMTTGEGGMVVTNNPTLARKVKLVRECGSPDDGKTWYAYECVGSNYNMTEIQAAIGIVQLAKLPQMNEKRKENAIFYRERFADTRLLLPSEHQKVQHVYHNFSMLVPQGEIRTRDEFVEAVRAENIPIDVCYPTPLYQTKLFADPTIRKGPLAQNKYPRYSNVECPNAEDVTSRIVNLYTDPAIDDQLRSDIVAGVKKVALQFY